MTGSASRRPSRRAPAPRASDSKRNLRTWERTAREYEARHGRTLEREHGRAWGTFRVPESRLRLLGNVRGKRVLELGCGKADWSVALTRDGARCLGLDFSMARLRQARMRMDGAGVRFHLVNGSAERIPCRRARFDLVISDYGATTFADPRRTLPEASRVLREGGTMVFAHASPFRSVAQDLRADRFRRRLVRPYFGLRTLRTPESVEFQLPYGAWIELFSSCGLVVDRLVEPVAPSSWRTSYLGVSDQRWGRRWPVDAIWKLRKLRARRRPIRPRR